jgi:hypothetical protein
VQAVPDVSGCFDSVLCKGDCVGCERDRRLRVYPIKCRGCGHRAHLGKCWVHHDASAYPCGCYVQTPKTHDTAVERVERLYGLVRALVTVDEVTLHLSVNDEAWDGREGNPRFDLAGVDNPLQLIVDAHRAGRT